MLLQTDGKINECVCVPSTTTATTKTCKSTKAITKCLINLAFEKSNSDTKEHKSQCEMLCFVSQNLCNTGN